MAIYSVFFLLWPIVPSGITIHVLEFVDDHLEKRLKLFRDCTDGMFGVGSGCVDLCHSVRIKPVEALEALK